MYTAPSRLTDWTGYITSLPCPALPLLPLSRTLFEGDVNPASEIVLDRQGALGIEQPGGAAGRRPGGLAGARSVPAGDNGASVLEEEPEETSLNPLVLDAADEWLPSEGECRSALRHPAAPQAAAGGGPLLALLGGAPCSLTKHAD